MSFRVAARILPHSVDEGGTSSEWCRHSGMASHPQQFDRRRMETSYRPMTRREKEELKSLVSPGTALLRTGFFLLAVGSTGWLLREIQEFVTGASGLATNLPFWLIPTLIVGVFLYVRGGRWTGGPELRGLVRLDLKRGEMALHRVRTIRALEAPEIEDEGPVFFLLDEDGETLFFAGQEMAGYKTRGFPWLEFHIQETPEARRFFRLRPLAGPFPDVETRSPLTWEEVKRLGVLSSTYGRMEQSIEELKAESS